MKRQSELKRNVLNSKALYQIAKQNKCIKEEKIKAIKGGKDNVKKD